MRSVTRLAMVAGMLLVAGAAPAQAQTLDQDHEPPGLRCSATVRFGDAFAQVFTAGLTGTLDQVELYLSRTADTTAPITVEIRDASGSFIGTNVLASTTIAATSVPVGVPNAAFVAATFGAPAIVTAGTQYAIVAFLRVPNYADAEYVWTCETIGTYAGGELFTTGSPPPPTGGWSGTGSDALFRTYVGVAEYATPQEVQGLSLTRQTLSFRLIKPAPVRFTLDRRLASKRFRRVGSFTRRAHQGRNRTRIPAKLNGRRLRKGVYRLSARALSAVGTGPVARRVIELR
jgi:hypothetical protein